MNNWFTEKCFPDWAQTFEIENIVLEGKSKYQTIKIFDTKQFGRVLVLDDIVQCTERDEFIYHEMLTHVPINAYGDARSVLILGGGDGGILEEILKHNSVRSVTMVEIDAEVVNACKAFMPSICKKAFDDPRVELIYADAVGYVAVTNKKFDVIIIDRSDGIGPNAELYTKSFYQDCKQLLTPEGILVAQSGSLLLSQNFIKNQLTILRSIWKDVGCYTLVLPTYPGGLIAILWAANWNIAVSDLKQPIPNLQYYNADIHRTSFVLPNYAGTFTN